MQDDDLDQQDEPEIKRIGEHLLKIMRSQGVIRCLRVSEQETQEWQRKEEARRARQVIRNPNGRQIKLKNSAPIPAPA